MLWMTCWHQVTLLQSVSQEPVVGSWTGFSTKCNHRPLWSRLPDSCSRSPTGNVTCSKPASGLRFSEEFQAQTAHAKYLLITWSWGGKTEAEFRGHHRLISGPPQGARKMGQTQQVEVKLPTFQQDKVWRMIPCTWNRQRGCGEWRVIGWLI